LESGHVRYLLDGKEHEITAEFVLANLPGPELSRLMGQAVGKTGTGAQVKVNMLLKRLPRLKSQLDPRAAFGGTFHINENFSQLQMAFDSASAGEIPNPLPCEIYCHSLTDPSILSLDLQQQGVQTLTVFALHTPHELLLDQDNELFRAKLQDAVLDSLNLVLAEDIRELLLEDAFGQPCIETKTTKDLEDLLRLPGGNIFHEPLSWPFAEDDEELETPAQRWGVATDFEKILLCGSSARRGGAVSGIAGHNAAMAVLES
jgi:phytoene dehydrogenase-like protein